MQGLTCAIRPKDIVSPAQNTILKILTTIFRDRQSKAILTDEKGRKLPIEKSISSYPLKYDVKLVNYLLTQFRQCITPQTCSLIFLQGQIAIGRAQPQDFPLSLWDMERMYDGVYQYLEFFAILTENDVWKKMMADWQMTSELITLLRELDTAIPKRQRRPNPIKAPGQPPGQPPTDAKATKKQPGVATSVTDQAGRPPVAVERPYEVNSERQPGSSAAPTEERDSAVESSAQADELHGEAAGFEWKNLKKLAILVLSSLIYKSRKVQDQVRTMAGVEVILACCNYDEHNPYIREHAIMCLRFLIEGNKENQDIIRTLEARRVVPSEVLDQRGYETFMDSRGQVGLRRKIAARTQAKK